MPDGAEAMPFWHGLRPRIALPIAQCQYGEGLMESAHRNA